MHKKIFASVLAVTLVIGSISVAHAESYIITSTWNDSVIIPYEELIDLASLVTIEVSAGRTSASPGASVQIRNNGSNYYIAIINANQSVAGYVGSSTSHNVYVAQGRGYLYNLVDSIDTYCHNIQSLITGLANTVGNLYSSDPTNPKILNNIEDLLLNKNYTSYASDDENVPYSLYEISNSTATEMIAHLNNTLVDRSIYYISTAGVPSKYTFVSAQENNGYIRVRIRNNNSNPTYYNVCLCTPERSIYHYSNNSSSNTFDDSNIIDAIEALGVDLTTIEGNIQNIISQINPNLYCTSSGSAEFKISKQVANAMIAYINSQCLGKPIKYVASNGNLTTFYIRGCYFYPSNNRIRVTIEYENGSAYSTTCFLCNKYLYKYVVENDSIESSIISLPTKVDTVAQKLDDIYDWLDNADLSVNQTIINIVNNTTNDVNSANDFYERVLGLFKKSFGSFDDNYELTNWGDALTYFDTLWSDPVE